MTSDVSMHPEQGIANPTAQHVEQQAKTAADNQGAPDRGQTNLDQTKVQTDTLVAQGALPDTKIVMSGAAGSSAEGKADAPGSGAAVGSAQTDAPTDPAQTPKTYQMGDGMGNQKPDPAVSVLQTELTNLGYPTGGADGRFGSQTKTSVTDFQKANGLPQNGELDPATQKALADPKAVKNPDMLTPDEVNAEAQKLEPMIQQFMKSADYKTQKAAIESYQQELGNLSIHGEKTTNQVLTQVASDLKKSDKTMDVETGPIFGEPTFGFVNKDFVKGLSEDVPTSLYTSLTSKGPYTKGTDGDGDYDTQFELTTTVSNGKATMKDNAYQAQDYSGYTGGGYTGGGASSPGPSDAPSSPTVNVQNPNGSYGGTAEDYNGIIIRNGDNPNPY